MAHKIRTFLKQFCQNSRYVAWCLVAEGDPRCPRSIHYHDARIISTLRISNYDLQDMSRWGNLKVLHLYILFFARFAAANARWIIAWSSTDLQVDRKSKGQAIFICAFIRKVRSRRVMPELRSLLCIFENSSKCTKTFRFFRLANQPSFPN